MRRTIQSKLTSSLVAITHLVFSVLMVSPGLVQAQSTDVDPPFIELELVGEGVTGETQVFSATVSDNESVSSVTLFYRLGSTATYTAVPMSAIQGTDIYTASIDTSNTGANLIQYYMEARDAGGNRTVQGFAFDPFERVLNEESVVASESVVAAAPVVPVAAPRMSTRRKLIYGALGVLVVGGLASSLGGGSSSGGGNEQVNLTILVDQFQ